MAIITQQHIERILIVFNEDGSLKGAHQEKIERIKDGGNILAEKQLPAETIDAISLINLLPNQAQLLEQNSILLQRVTELEQMLA